MLKIKRVNLKSIYHQRQITILKRVKWLYNFS